METKLAAGAAVLVIAWIVKALLHVDVPHEVQDALTILITVGVMWLVPERNPSSSSVEAAIDRGLAQPPDPPARA